MKKEEENARPDNAKLVPEIKHFFKVFTCQTFYKWKEINKKKTTSFVFSFRWKLWLSLWLYPILIIHVLDRRWKERNRYRTFEILFEWRTGRWKKKKREKKENLAQPLYFSSSSTLFIDVASNGALSLKRCIRCVMQDWVAELHGYEGGR